MTAIESTERRLQSSRYCAVTDDGIIEIQPRGPRDETYRIGLDELDTLAKLQDWIRHLAQRSGYTADVLGDLVTFHARLCDRDREVETESDSGTLLADCIAETGLRPPISRDSAGLARTEY